MRTFLESVPIGRSHRVTFIDHAIAGAVGGQVDMGDEITFQAILTGTGAITASVDIEGSLDGTNWLTIANIAMTGDTKVVGGFMLDESWIYVSATLATITGTGATLTLYGRV